MKELLLIQSLDLDGLIEEYRLFFLGLMPSVFILAILIEFFAELEPFALAKRALISILLLVSVSSFYQQSIDYSMETADKVLKSQILGNNLLEDMLNKRDHLNLSRTPLEGNKTAELFSFFQSQFFKDVANNIFTITTLFIVCLCLLLLKVIYSLVYYLGYGLMGIPCLLYLFPNMGRVLYGGVMSYLWCLILPHVLVFIFSMLGTEIKKGYVEGEIIGGNIMGTALLFVLALTVAFVPMITASILSRSGIMQAGGIISAVGAHKILSLPKNMAKTALKWTAAITVPKLLLSMSASKMASNLAKKGAGLLSFGPNSYWGGGQSAASDGQSQTREASPKTGEVGSKASFQNQKIKTKTKENKSTNLSQANLSSNGKKTPVGQTGNTQARPQNKGGNHARLPKHHQGHPRGQAANGHHRRSGDNHPDRNFSHRNRPQSRPKRR